MVIGDAVLAPRFTVQELERHENIDPTKLAALIQTYAAGNKGKLRGKFVLVTEARELAVSRALAGAAQIISANPTTLPLRYLQTLAEIATEMNSTIVFPIPIDFLSGILKR